MGLSGSPSQARSILGSTPDAEKSLLQDMARGDTAAFDRLYDRHFVTVQRAVTSRISNSHDAEDVISEVFMRFWRCAPHFRGDAQVRTWLRTITRNAVTDYYRKTSRRRHVTPFSAFVGPSDLDEHWVELLPDPRPTPEDSLLTLEERREVADALLSLEDHQRSILRLRYNSQLSLEQISRRLHAPVGTVKSRLHRAVRALRRVVVARLGP